jgi:hypothetical protein
VIRFKLLSGLPARTWETDLARVRIGRAVDADVSLAGHPSRVVSEEHAIVEFRDGWYRVVDAGSRNGTFVNGELLSAPRPLRDGDLLQLGADTGPQIEVTLVYDPERWRDHVLAGAGPAWGPLAALGVTTLLVLGIGAWLLLSP